MVSKPEYGNCHALLNMRFFSHKPNFQGLMARQSGIIKLKGTIGDVSFYKSKDGYLAREKGGVDAERIKNDPAFQRTRENGSEFGRAGKAGKTLRNSLRLLIQNASDSKVTSRLTREMMRVLQTDSVNIRGARTVTDGNVLLLNGFDFNINGKLNTTMYAPYDVILDRADGSITLTVPDFVPGSTIAFPSGATQMKFVSGAALVNFETEAFEFNQALSPEIALGPQTEPSFDLVTTFTGGSTDVIFLVLGIDFMQEVNGVMYPLNNGAYNPLAIIQVDAV